MKKIVSLFALLFITIAHTFAQDSTESSESRCWVGNIEFEMSFDSESPTCQVVGYTGSEVIIPETITYNEVEYAVIGVGDIFRGDTSLESVSLPKGVITIRNSAFSGCSSLTSVIFPAGLTSIGNSAFSGCSSLTSVIFPEGLTSIGSHAFEYCSSLTSVIFPAGLTSIGGKAFYKCTGLTSVTFPAGLTSIGSGVFSGCSSLTSVTLPEGLTSIGSDVFMNCSSLASITLPKGTQEIGYHAFGDCVSLADVTLSEELTSIGSYAFSGCSSLTSVIFPAGLTSIGSHAFTDLSDVSFMGETPPTGCEYISANLAFVPEGSVAAYQAALSKISTNAVLPIEAKTKVWEVAVEAKASTSALRDWFHAAGVSDDAMNQVVNLKVTGTINSYDFVQMRDKLVNLLSVDLSEARVVYNAYEHYNGCHTEDDRFPAYAFYDAKLKECKLPQTLTDIGMFAFYSTGLEEIVLPDGITTIGDRAFFSCVNLQKVKLPATLETIEGDAFSYCKALKAIILPPSLKRIGGGAFCQCHALEEIRLPSSIQSIGYSAFSGCTKLTRVYTYTIEPVAISDDAFGTEAYNGTLYCPETAYDNYYYGTGSWKKFLNLEAFNEPYEYFYLNNDFTMEEDTPRLDGVTDEETGTVTPPDADLNAGSGLIVKGDETQELDDVHLKGDGADNSGTIIGDGEGNGNIHAKNLHIDIEVEANRWYFFSFPYDINRTNIKYKGNYVFRYYDGAERAENGSGGWKDVAIQDKEYLKAGVGYIFQGDKTGTLTLKVSDVIFNSDDFVTDLNNHESDNAQDAGWNLVGNPYTAYFNIQDMGYEHPITIWNGTTYVAISPQDDDHVFYPYQAFFVQKPNGKVEITFAADARQTKTQSEETAAQKAKARRMKSAANPNRKLVNLTITDGTTTDKTRVVFNNERKVSYEMECDAAKFLAGGVPQLYSLDATQVKYAINERPEGNGSVNLGVNLPANGTYTIGVTRADFGVMLKDNLTGTTHDFANGDYTFSAKAGASDTRFELITKGVTGIGNVQTEGVAVVEVKDREIVVSNADGLSTVITASNGVVVGGFSGNGSVKVAQGIYIVKVGEQTQKVIVK